MRLRAGAQGRQRLRGLDISSLCQFRRKDDLTRVEQRRRMAADLQREGVPGDRAAASGQEQGGEDLGAGDRR